MIVQLFCSRAIFSGMSIYACKYQDPRFSSKDGVSHQIPSMPEVGYAVQFECFILLQK